MRSDDQEGRHPVVIPDEFFVDQLPGIRDLSELKMVLHVFHMSARAVARAVPLEELLASDVARSVAIDQTPVPSTERLQASLERAIANGVVLRLTVRGPEGPRVFVLPATAYHRKLVERFDTDPDVAETINLYSEVEASLYRPNAFAFYERHIGLLTPLVAEQLRDAERSYPRAWIEAAILEAEVYNKRSWRYIEAILKQWEEGGTPERSTAQRP
jgi:DnaD/phage-associated family protein